MKPPDKMSLHLPNTKAWTAGSDCSWIAATSSRLSKYTNCIKWHQIAGASEIDMIGMKTQRKHLRPPLHWAGWSSCPTVPPKINRRLEHASRDYPSALRCTWRPRLRRDCSKWSILSHCAALVVFYHVSSPVRTQHLLRSALNYRSPQWT